jgi:hypothetical protein
MACDMLCTPCPDITCGNLKLNLPRFSSKLAVLDLAPRETAVVHETTSRAKQKNFLSSGDRFDPELHVTDAPLQGSTCTKIDRLT